MSGDFYGMNWGENNRQHDLEGVARSKVCGCNAPMILVIAPTAVVERCGQCGRLEHFQLVYGAGWFHEA